MHFHNVFMLFNICSRVVCFFISVHKKCILPIYAPHARARVHRRVRIAARAPRASGDLLRRRRPAPAREAVAVELRAHGAGWARRGEGMGTCMANDARALGPKKVRAGIKNCARALKRCPRA